MPFARSVADARAMNVIEVSDLTKRYGDRAAVDGVSFSVEEGEIFGILGPNGAGKTTTVESIAGLRTPDSGTIRVLGLDPARGPRPPAHRRRRPAPGERAARPDDRPARRSSCSPRSTTIRPTRASCIDDLGLADKRDTAYRNLSGGQKQRLSIALALVGRPRIAILDELSTGLDPQARRDTWDLIESIRDRGVTVLLVTHLMEEAERLADRVAVIRDGRRDRARHAGRHRLDGRPGAAAPLPAVGADRGPAAHRPARGPERPADRSDARRHRDRQPHRRRHRRPGAPRGHRQRPADRAGEPRRGLPRPHRTPVRRTSRRSCHEGDAHAHRHRGEAAVPRSHHLAGGHRPAVGRPADLRVALPAAAGSRRSAASAGSTCSCRRCSSSPWGRSASRRCRSASRPTARRASCAGCRRRRPTRPGCSPPSSSSTA